MGTLAEITAADLIVPVREPCTRDGDALPCCHCGKTDTIEHVRDYRMSVFEPCDLGEVERWLINLPFETLKQRLETLGDTATDAMRETLVASATKESDTLSYDDARATKILGSLAGVCYMLWISLRKRQPELTREDVYSLLTLETLDVWQGRLDNVASDKALKKNGKRTKPKRAKRPRPKMRRMRN